MISCLGERGLISREIDGLSYGHLLVYYKLKEQFGKLAHDSAISCLHLTDQTLQISDFQWSDLGTVLELCGQGYHKNILGECSGAQYTYIFEHSSDQGIVKDVAALDMNDQSMTYEFWINVSGSQNGAQPYIFKQEQFVEMYIDPGTLSASFNYIAQPVNTVMFTLNSNTWVHLAAFLEIQTISDTFFSVFFHSLIGSTYTSSVGGSSAPLAYFSIPDIGSPRNSGKRNLYIGYNGVPTDADQRLEGSLIEFKIFTGLRDYKSIIAQAYNVASISSDLKVYYRMNVISTQTQFDYSGNSADIVMSSSSLKKGYVLDTPHICEGNSYYDGVQCQNQIWLLNPQDTFSGITLTNIINVYEPPFFTLSFWAFYDSTALSTVPAQIIFYQDTVDGSIHKLYFNTTDFSFKGALCGVAFDSDESGTQVYTDIPFKDAWNFGVVQKIVRDTDDYITIMFNNYATVPVSTSIPQTTCTVPQSLKIYAYNQALHLRDVSYYAKASPWPSILEDSRIYPDLNLISFYALTEKSLRFQNVINPTNFQQFEFTLSSREFPLWRYSDNAPGLVRCKQYKGYHHSPTSGLCEQNKVAKVTSTSQIRVFRYQFPDDKLITQQFGFFEWINFDSLNNDQALFVITNQSSSPDHVSLVYNSQTYQFELRSNMFATAPFSNLQVNCTTLCNQWNLVGVKMNPPTDATLYFNSQDMGSVSWALIPFDSYDYSVSMTIGAKVTGLTLDVNIFKGFLFTDLSLITSSFLLELMNGNDKRTTTGFYQMQFTNESENAFWIVNSQNIQPLSINEPCEWLDSSLTQSDLYHQGTIIYYSLVFSKSRKLSDELKVEVAMNPSSCLFTFQGMFRFFGSQGKAKFSLIYPSTTNSLLDIEFDRDALIVSVDFDSSTITRSSTVQSSLFDQIIRFTISRNTNDLTIVINQEIKLVSFTHTCTGITSIDATVSPSNGATVSFRYLRLWTVSLDKSTAMNSQNVRLSSSDATLAAEIQFSLLQESSNGDYLFQLSNKGEIIDPSLIVYTPGNLLTVASSELYQFSLKLCKVGQRYSPQRCLSQSKSVVRVESGIQFQSGAFQLQSTVSDPLSIELWLYITYSDGAKLHPLISLGTDNLSEEFVLHEDGTSQGLQINIGGTQSCGPSINTISQNSWTYVELVLLGNSQAEVYGSDVKTFLDSSTCNAVSQAVIFNQLQFLRTQGASASQEIPTGFLKQIAIWNRKLEDYEIISRRFKTLDSTSLASNSLIYYFKLDGFDSYNDMAGVLNLANPSKPPLSFKAPRPYLQDFLALSFQFNACRVDDNLYANPLTRECETISHYVLLAHSHFQNSVTLPSKSRISQSNDITIEFQVKWHQQIPTAFKIFIADQQSGNSQFGLRCDGSGAYQGYKDGTSTALSSEFALNRWIHFIISYSDEAQSLSFIHDLTTLSSLNSVSLSLWGGNSSLKWPQLDQSVDYSFKIKELRIWNAFHSSIQLSQLAYSQLSTKENKLISYFPLRDYILYDKISGEFLTTAQHDRLNYVFIPDNIIIPSEDDTVIRLDKDPFELTLQTYGDPSTVQKFEEGLTFLIWTKLESSDTLQGDYCFVSHINNFQFCKDVTNSYYYFNYFFTEDPFSMKYEFLESVELNKWKLYSFSVNKMTKTVLLKTSTWNTSHSLSGAIKILDQAINSNTVTVGFSSGFKPISLLSRAITILKYPFPLTYLLNDSFSFSTTLTEALRINYLNYLYRQRDYENLDEMTCSISTSLCPKKPTALSLTNSVVVNLSVPASAQFDEYSILVTSKLQISNLASASVTLANYCGIIVLELSGSSNRIDSTHQDVNSVTNVLQGPTGIPLNTWLYLSVSYSSPTKILTVDDLSSPIYKSEVTNSEGPFECQSGIIKIASSLANSDYIHLRHIRLIKQALTQGEIRDLRNRRIPLLNIESLIRAGYEMDQGLGGMLSDITSTLSTDLSSLSDISWLNDDFQVPRTCDESLLYDGKWCHSASKALQARTTCFEVNSSVNLTPVQFTLLLWFKVTGIPSQSILLHLTNFLTIQVSNPSASTIRVIVKNPSSGGEAIRLSGASQKLNKFVALTLASRSIDSYVALDEQMHEQSSQLSLPTLTLISEKLYLLGTSPGQASSIQGFQLHSIGLWSQLLHSQTALKAASLKIPNRSTLLFFHSAASSFVNYVDFSPSAISSDQDDYSEEPLLFKQCSISSDILESGSNTCLALPRYLCFTAGSSASFKLDSISFTSRFTLSFWLQAFSSAVAGSFSLSLGGSYMNLQLSNDLQIQLIIDNESTAQNSIPYQKWLYVTVASQYHLKHSFTIMSADTSFNFYNQHVLSRILGGIDLSQATVSSTFQGTVCLARLAVFPFAMHRFQAESLLYINQIPRSDMGSISTYLLRDSTGTYLEGVETDVDGSAINPSWKIGVYDNIGIDALQCLQSGQSYSLQNNACEPAPFSCSGGDLCNESGTELVCTSGNYQRSIGCTTQCADTESQHASNCHETLCLTFFQEDETRCTLTGTAIKITASASQDNTLSLVFEEPLTAPSGDLLPYFLIEISGPRTSYEYTTNSATCVSESALNNQLLCSEVEISVIVFSKIQEGAGVYAIIQIDNSLYFSTPSGRLLESTNVNVQLNYQNNPKASNEIKVVEGMTTAIQPVIGVGVAGSFIASSIVDFSLKNVWNMINTAQMLDYLPLINVYLPSNAEIVFGMLSFANADLFFIEMIPTPFDALIDTNSLQDNREALTPHYRERDYPTSVFYPNYRTKITLLFYLGFVALICFILRRVFNKRTRCTKCWPKLEQFYSMDFWIRVAIELFIDSIFATTLACYDLAFSSGSMVLSSLLWILFFPATLLFTVFVWLIIIKRRKQVANNPEWRFKELTKEFNVKQKRVKNMLFYPVFLLERTLFAFVLIFLRNHPILQCLFCFLLFIPPGVYVYWMLPFSDMILNYVYLLDRFVLLGVMSTLTYLGEYGYLMEERTADKIGFFLISLILLSVMVNFLLSIVRLISKLCLVCKCVKEKNSRIFVVDSSHPHRHIIRKKLELSDNRTIEVIQETDDPFVDKKYKGKERKIQTAYFDVTPDDNLTPRRNSPRFMTDRIKEIPEERRSHDSEMEMTELHS